jgi:hypothetical protein
MGDMNTGCSSSENWKRLFQAAMLELDKTKLPERIRDAQLAIVNHMEEFFRKETTTPDEHQMLYDALTSLRDLQRLCQKCEDRVCERKQNKKYRLA